MIKGEVVRKMAIMVDVDLIKRFFDEVTTQAVGNDIDLPVISGVIIPDPPSEYTSQVMIILVIGPVVAIVIGCTMASICGLVDVCKVHVWRLRIINGTMIMIVILEHN